MAGRATSKVIIEAAIQCIERYGLDQVTTRRIAIEAGTNLASINYHFRSKDHLIAETMKLTIEHMLEDVFATLERDDQPFERTLNEVFYYLLDGSRRYPGITRAHLNQAIRIGRGSISFKAMSRVFDRLARRATDAFPTKDRRELRLRLAQVVSGIMFAVLKPDFFPVPPQYQLTSANRARRLATSYANLFLGGV